MHAVGGSGSGSGSCKRWALVSFQKASEAQHCCDQRKVLVPSDHGQVKLHVRPVHGSALSSLPSNDGQLEDGESAAGEVSKYVVPPVRIGGTGAADGGSGCDDEVRL